jgi:hypothetical protein
MEDLMNSPATNLKHTLHFARATGAIGAWVEGLSLGSVPSAEAIRALRHALADYGVLFFDFGRIPTELGTQHRGVNDFIGPRKLKRLTVAGDKPSREFGSQGRVGKACES